MHSRSQPYGPWLWSLIPTPPQAYPLLILAGTAWLLLVVELHRARERRRGRSFTSPATRLIILANPACDA